MNSDEWIKSRVKKYYWDEDLNCATTTLKILAEKFNITLATQVFDSAVGMHGAGKYGAQCGLVEGTLLFIGIAGRIKKIPDDEIADFCRRYAREFEKEYGSLLCGKLRPQGFNPDNPPHLCETLTNRAVKFSIHFILDVFWGSCRSSL